MLEENNIPLFIGCALGCGLGNGAYLLTRAFWNYGPQDQEVLASGQNFEFSNEEIV